MERSMNVEPAPTWRSATWISRVYTCISILISPAISISKRRRTASLGDRLDIFFSLSTRILRFYLYPMWRIALWCHLFIIIPYHTIPIIIVLFCFFSLSYTYTYLCWFDILTCVWARSCAAATFCTARHCQGRWRDAESLGGGILSFWGGSGGYRYTGSRSIGH